MEGRQHARQGRRRASRLLLHTVEDVTAAQRAAARAARQRAALPRARRARRATSISSSRPTGACPTRAPPRARLLGGRSRSTAWRGPSSRIPRTCRRPSGCWPPRRGRAGRRRSRAAALLARGRLGALAGRARHRPRRGPGHRRGGGQPPRRHRAARDGAHAARAGAAGHAHRHAQPALVLDALRQAVDARAAASGRPLGVVLFDVDRFKLVNDTLGHPAGDRLLMDAHPPHRARCCAPSDTVARLGGDEFVVLIEDLRTSTTPSSSNRVAEAATGSYAPRAAARRPASRSRSAWPPTTAARTPDTLLAHADAALYRGQARRARPHRGLRPRAAAALVRTACALEHELHRALADDEFVLHWQPIIRTRDGAIARRRGAPALAAPRARPAAPRRVPGGRRGGRADAAHRRLGARPRARPGRDWQELATRRASSSTSPPQQLTARRWPRRSRAAPPRTAWTRRRLPGDLASATSTTDLAAARRAAA